MLALQTTLQTIKSGGPQFSEFACIASIVERKGELILYYLSHMALCLIHRTGEFPYKLMALRAFYIYESMVFKHVNDMIKAIRKTYGL